MRLFKVLTIVFFTSLSFSAHSFMPHMMTENTLDRVKFELWNYGVHNNNQKDMDRLNAMFTEVESQLSKESEEQHSWPHSYPEELVYPIMKMNLI